jgi:hypothetical protein
MGTSQLHNLLKQFVYSSYNKKEIKYNKVTDVYNIIRGAIKYII